MRIIFILNLFFALSSLAIAQPIQGLVTRASNQAMIQLSNSNDLLQLTSSNKATADLLLKLSSGDFIVATGEINADTKSVDLKSIDYVGLKKILGKWFAQEAVLDFKSFNELNIYSAVNVTSANQNMSIGVYRDLRYSIVPSTSDSWMMMISDSEDTSLVSLKLGNSYAHLIFYDADSGKPIKDLHLIRTGIQ